MAGITPVTARRSTEHGSGLGVHRWIIEQSIALPHGFRGLRIRWEIHDDIHELSSASRLRHHLLAPTRQHATLLEVLYVGQRINIQTRRNA